MLCGARDTDSEDIWRDVAQSAADIAMEGDRQRERERETRVRQTESLSTEFNYIGDYTLYTVQTQGTRVKCT